LIRRNGKLYTYEREGAFEGDQFRYQLQDRFGIRREVLDGNTARDLEPALSPAIRKAVFWPDYGWTTNPSRLTTTIVEEFVRRNGILRQTTVREIELGADGPSAVITDDGRWPIGRIVIAAGVWSKKFAARLGSNVSMESERGYHLTMPTPGIALTRTVMSYDRFISATPMECGLRVTGVSEFAGTKAPARLGRTKQVLHHARELLPGVNADGASHWMGQRPSTPDSLPIIGRAPRHPNVYFAFGHFGLTLGAISGRLVAELAAGRPTSVDLAPYRPDRF
jgi:D-amino-acid dehydrogenase